MSCHGPHMSRSRQYCPQQYLSRFCSGNRSDWSFCLKISSRKVLNTVGLRVGLKHVGTRSWEAMQNCRASGSLRRGLSLFSLFLCLFSLPLSFSLSSPSSMYSLPPRFASFSPPRVSASPLSLSVSLTHSLPPSVSVCLSVSPSLCLSVSLSLCLSVSPLSAGILPAVREVDGFWRTHVDFSPGCLCFGLAQCMLCST